MYGAIAEAHLKAPRNIGKLADADGVGTVEDAASDTLVTIYVRVRDLPNGRREVGEARFRAFGCGGCIVTGSIATELATGLTVEEAADLDGPAIMRALDDGLPPEQRYCADLAAHALRLACQAATR